MHSARLPGTRPQRRTTEANHVTDLLDRDRRILDDLQRRGAESVLQRLSFSKRAHKQDREYQLWQEGSHAELVCSEEVMRQKLDYIHHNPVRRGYVDLAEHWRYSSARDYQGQAGLLVIDRLPS